MQSRLQCALECGCSRGVGAGSRRVLFPPHTHGGPTRKRGDQSKTWHHGEGVVCCTLFFPSRKSGLCWGWLTLCDLCHSCCAALCCWVCFADKIKKAKLLFYSWQFSKICLYLTTKRIIIKKSSLFSFPRIAVIGSLCHPKAFWPTQLTQWLRGTKQTPKVTAGRRSDVQTLGVLSRLSQKQPNIRAAPTETHRTQLPSYLRARAEPNIYYLCVAGTALHGSAASSNVRTRLRELCSQKGLSLQQRRTEWISAASGG